MDCKEYGEYIRKEINRKADYDGYIHTFVEYREYLEKRLEENSNDVEAACQLCGVLLELREDDKTCALAMKRILSDNETELSSDDLIRIYTNIAGIYLHNKGNFSLLRKAVGLNGNYPEPYEALGILYMEKGYTKAAEGLFLKALELKNDSIYLYNYALSLYSNGKIQKAFDILESLPQDNYSFSYACAVCLYKLCEIEKAQIKAKSLLDNPDVDMICLANLFLSCKNYAKGAELYEKYGTGYVRRDWTVQYLCCLTKIKSPKLESEYQRICGLIKVDIEDFRNEPIDENFTGSYRDGIIFELEKELSELCEYYNSGCREFVPEIPIYCMETCFLIDCPKHKPI